MVLKAKEKSVGAWMFLFGVILALIFGILTSKFLSIDAIIKYSSPIYAILVIIGLYVGYKINVEGKNAQTFLITSAILVVVSRFGMESVTGSLIGIGVGDLVTSTFSALLTLFVPATIVVAIKSLFSSARV